jgi:NAD(P)H dehydrogenase (quinone)
VDDEDVGAVAAACLLGPERHRGVTYRMGYEARTFNEVADIFTRVIGQPFSYEARPPEEFLPNVLAAGSEPVYVKCIFDSYASLTAGEERRAGEVVDNYPTITGRNPKTLADFAKTNQKQFRYPAATGRSNDQAGAGLPWPPFEE